MSPAPSRAAACPLRADWFRPIIEPGGGNPRSRIAHATQMFGDRLFVGVTHPRGDGPEDCARILRRDFATGTWDEVHRAPLRPADARVAHIRDLQGRARAHTVSLGTPLPRERGFRGAAVFQGRSDQAPALYVSTISNWGGLILRSGDGETFEPVSAPGLIDDRLLSFRALVPFRGRLFTTPIGALADGVLDRNGTLRPVVLCSDDPAGGDWREASAPGFGNADNTVVFQMAAHGSWLYAGTGNPKTGMEIWKTDAEGRPPFHWRRVLAEGAERFALNESAASLVPFGDALYVGTGLPGLGRDRVHGIGPAAAELLRIWPDDSWELLMGQPRFSHGGLRLPRMAMGPGFDDFHNSVVWRMAVHDGWLYVGTHHWGVYRAAADGAPHPWGGFHLWATPDGETWTAVSRDGLGDAFAVGVRGLVSTPFGLVLGTDDHGALRQTLARRAGNPPGWRSSDGKAGGFMLSLADDPDRTAPVVVGPTG